MDGLEQVNLTIQQIQQKVAEFEKTVTSADTAFPVRENLAAEAKLVIPVDTPLLNRFPTKPGSGKAAAWKEITGLGSSALTYSMFYAEAGAPSSRTTVYADRSETYKLAGLDGGVAGFAIAAGANFQDQLAIEKRNCLLHLKRLEETALINADGTGYAFSGLLTQIVTGNGSTVRPKTGTAASAVLADLDYILKGAWDNGGDITLLVLRSAESKMISDSITQNAGTSPMRVTIDQQSLITGGFFVNAYISPLNGRRVELIPDKFHTTGTIIGVAENLPAPIAGQGGEGVYLDVLLDYALSDVPTSNDSVLFRIKRYYTVPMPSRRFCATITGY
jgi:hypothetical protein